MIEEKRVYIYSTIKVYACTNIIFSFLALVVSTLLAGTGNIRKTIDCWSNDKCDHIFIALWILYTVINTFSILTNITVNIKTTNIVIFTHIASYILTAFYLLFDVTDIISVNVSFVTNYFTFSDYFSVAILAAILLSCLFCASLHLRTRHPV